MNVLTRFSFLGLILTTVISLGCGRSSRYENPFKNQTTSKPGTSSIHMPTDCFTNPRTEAEIQASGERKCTIRYSQAKCGSKVLATCEGYTETFSGDNMKSILKVTLGLEKEKNTFLLADSNTWRVENPRAAIPNYLNATEVPIGDYNGGANSAPKTDSDDALARSDVYNALHADDRIGKVDAKLILYIQSVSVSPTVQLPLEVATKGCD